MTIKTKQRWKYRDVDPKNNIVGEIIEVYVTEYFDIRIVSYGPLATHHKDYTYHNQWEGNWEYLPGQDAP